MLRIAIVEDDRNYIQQLQRYLQRYSQESEQAMDISVLPTGMRSRKATARSTTLS